jgi:hypothetical protein
LPHYRRHIFATPKDANNIDCFLDSLRDDKKIFLTFLAQTHVSKRIDGYDTVAMLLHVSSNTVTIFARLFGQTNYGNDHGLFQDILCLSLGQSQPSFSSKTIFMVLG